MIDCHAHLAVDAFAVDRQQVLERAHAVGVQCILVVGEDADDDQRVLNLCALHADLLSPCIGFHPDRFSEQKTVPRQEAIEAVMQLARVHRSELVAIGEVGLDYWYAKSDQRRAAQRACLERMVALAEELALPLNVHSRSAGHHTLDLLTACGARQVLMHAFDGKPGYAMRAAEQYGYLFSVPPSIVRSSQKQKLVRRLPLEALALESDSPVLGPRPEVRNEPAHLVHAVRCIAQLKGICEDEVREITTRNARRLFSLGAEGV